MAYMSYVYKITVLGAVAGIAALLLRYIHRALFNPLKSVPGPWYTQITSLPSKWYAIRGTRVRWIHSLHEQYGSVVRILPYEASISDLASVREIHKISTHFLKSDWYNELIGRQRPNVFALADPHLHRTRRALMAQPMSESALKKVESKVSLNIGKAINGMAVENDQTGATDILKWLTYMATDVIGELSFGESFRMLDQVKPNQYYYDLQNIGKVTTYSAELGKLCIILGGLGLQPFASIISNVKHLQEYSTQSVARYEKLVAANPDNPEPTLFTKLYTKKSAGQISREELISEGVGYIVAGSDTTAVTTTYMIWNVCRSIEVRRKLLEEIADVNDHPSWDELKDLPYLNKVMKETLRLCGAAPGSLKRDVPPTGATLAGHAFPAGTIVSTQSYTLHRDPRIWYQPEAFDPGRWDEPTLEMNHAFMAFGGGTRVCIGLHLAKMEMAGAVVRFFKRFPNAQNRESDEGMEQAAYLLMAPAGHRCLVELGRDLKSEKLW